MGVQPLEEATGQVEIVQVTGLRLAPSVGVELTIPHPIYRGAVAPVKEKTTFHPPVTGTATKRVGVDQVSMNDPSGLLRLPLTPGTAMKAPREGR